MAYIFYIKLWESEFDGIVSKLDKLEDDNISRIKLKVNEAYKKDEKTTTDSEPTDDLDAISKAYLDMKFKKNRWSYLLY